MQPSTTDARTQPLVLSPTVITVSMPCRLRNGTSGVPKNELGDEQRWRELTAVFPLGRLATVDEVANTVVFLCSDRSSYTTAAIITIDGGFSARPAQIKEW